MRAVRPGGVRVMTTDAAMECHGYVTVAAAAGWRRAMQQTQGILIGSGHAKRDERDTICFGQARFL